MVANFVLGASQIQTEKTNSDGLGNTHESVMILAHVFNGNLIMGGGFGA